MGRIILELGRGERKCPAIKDGMVENHESRKQNGWQG